MSRYVLASESFQCKIRHSGSHFYAIQKTTSINAGKTRSRVEIPFGETIEKHYRAAFKNIKKKHLIVKKDIVPYIDRNLREEIGDQVTKEEVEFAAIRFHDIRHSYATLMMENDVHPKTVQQILGHSSVKVTLDLYSHANVNQQQAALNVIKKIKK